MEIVIILSSLLVLPSHCIVRTFRTGTTQIQGFQVNSQGKVFIAAENTLYMLNSDLSYRSYATILRPAIGISISSSGQELVVCHAFSCTVYETRNLRVIVSADITFDELDYVAMLTAADTYYVARLTIPLIGSNGRILLRQYNFESRETIRSREFQTNKAGFDRIMFGGFSSGGYTYFVVLDRFPKSLRFMRVCHVTQCTGACSFDAVYEENFSCGGVVTNNASDRICGVSAVENFAGYSGVSVVITRCHTRSVSDNVVCVFRLFDLDNIMQRRYFDCLSGNGVVQSAWRDDILPCSWDNGTTRFQPMDLCNHGFSPGRGLGGGLHPTDRLPQVVGSVIASLGETSHTITASIPLTMGSDSLIFIAYTKYIHYIGKLLILNTTTTLRTTDLFDVQIVSSPVKSLQWQSGMNHVLAASNNEIFMVPLEECATNSNCFSCITEDNPLCGWCVVENKCSRQSQCRDGYSTRSIRWFGSSGLSSNINEKCISITVTPANIVVRNAQPLSVTVLGPGLPALLYRNEIYLCRLEDFKGRFVINVPAMVVEESRRYSCDITDELRAYENLVSVLHFSFLSSVITVPFGRTENVTSTIRCDILDSCSRCFEARGICKWCSFAKRCIVRTDVTCSEVYGSRCPTLDIEKGANNYTLQIRHQSEITFTTRNLFPGYRYMCVIRNRMFNATRNNETSLTCQVRNHNLQITSGTDFEVIDIGVTWNGTRFQNDRIETVNAPSVTLYDCRRLDTQYCSKCIGRRSTLGIKCGWCAHPTSTCFFPEECRQQPAPLITSKGQCPAPVITGFSPSSGPPDGGTILTIRGRDLGVVFSDFMEAGGSITVGGVICTPFNMNYISGVQVLCRTGSGMGEGAQRVEVNLMRDAGISTSRLDGFMVVLPTVSSVEPAFGPIAGGSKLTINGTGLDIGTSTRITLDEARELECRDIVRTSTQITCTSTNTSSLSSSPTPLVVHIDAQNIRGSGVQFQYRNNPRFTSIYPKNTIKSGGITVNFTGVDLDVSQNPQLIIYGVMSPCYNVDPMSLSCITPKLPFDKLDTVNYTLHLDRAPPPDFTAPDLRLSVRKDPSDLELLTENVARGSVSVIVTINGRNLTSVETREIRILVGNEYCRILSINDNQLTCILASGDPQSGTNTARVTVTIGRHLSYVLDEKLAFISGSVDDTALLQVILPVAIISFLLINIVILVIIVTRHYKKHFKLHFSPSAVTLECSASEKYREHRY